MTFVTWMDGWVSLVRGLLHCWQQEIYRQFPDKFTNPKQRERLVSRDWSFSTAHFRTAERNKKLRFVKLTNHYFGSLEGLHTNVISFMITMRCNISHLRTCIISVPTYNYPSPLYTRNVPIINNIKTTKNGYRQSNKLVDSILQLGSSIVQWTWRSVG